MQGIDDQLIDLTVIPEVSKFMAEPDGNGGHQTVMPFTFALQGEDEEKCSECKAHFAPGFENRDMTWIGCEFQKCGKWYHSVCIGISNDECK